MNLGRTYGTFFVCACSPRLYYSCTVRKAIMLAYFYVVSDSEICYSS